MILKKSHDMLYVSIFVTQRYQKNIETHIMYPINKYFKILKRSSIQILFLFCLLSSISCQNDELPEDNTALGKAFLNASENKNLRSLIVYKDGQIIKEHYFRNAGPNMAHDVRSVTKSITATLIGIAIDNGNITSVEQTIEPFIKPLTNLLKQDKANIKIGNLLTMTSGISGSDLSSVNEYESWKSSSNQLNYTLQKPMDHEPGEYFTYNSGASHMLSVILEQATNKSAKEFAKETLFQDLGINDHAWEKDKQGYFNGSAGICLTPHDMLKIGQLYLNKGVFNGKRVVSEAWINKVTSPQIPTRNIEPYANDYGYLWWLGESENIRYFFANGYGGQFIVVVPELNMVVVSTNEWSGVGGYTAGQQWYSTLSIIVKNILPIYASEQSSN